jgi:hypothetical protein
LAGKELIAEQISLAIVRRVALNAVGDSGCQVLAASHGFGRSRGNDFSLRRKRYNAQQREC